LFAPGYFRALQDYVEQVKAEDSRRRRSSSAAQGIVPPGTVQTYRERYEKLIKQRETPIVKTENPFSFGEFLIFYHRRQLSLFHLV
jgi:hypothetical protein